MADLQALVDGVRGKDYAVQSAASAAGAAAVAALAPLLQDADEEVRELAVHCLVATQAAAAAPVLAAALLDADSQVAMAAARALHTLATPALSAPLLQAFDSSSEPLLQYEIALVLGRLDDLALRPALRQRRQSINEPLAQQGLDAALARLGDLDARAAFAAVLRGSAGAQRLRCIELAEYIGQRWLLPLLAELLADTEELQRVAIDARPDLIQALRACDLALVLIARIGRATFSFAVTAAQNYGPAELDEARRFAVAAKP